MVEDKNFVIKGEFAKKLLKWAIAKRHYDAGIANEEELKLIEEQKAIDKRNAEKVKNYGITFIDETNKKE